MPLNVDGPDQISLGPTLSPINKSISVAFASTPPFSLSQFYRGGPEVADHPINNNIPAGPATTTRSFGHYNNGGSLVLRHVISSNVQNLNLFTYASSVQRPTSQDVINGYDQNRRYDAYQPGYGIEFIINPGVFVGSAFATQAALVTGTDSVSAWHPSVQIRIVNQGVIIGAGGAGGQGAKGFAPPTNALPGQGGGTAIDAQRPIYINNAGTIAGGGGGGGGGGATPPFAPLVGGGGGGGAGQTGGAGGTSLEQYVNQASQPGNGAAGTAFAGGNGGVFEPGVFPTGGRGGAGGGRGQNGNSGQNAGQTGLPHTFGALGGAAGYYIIGNSRVTWIAPGTQQGQEGV
jgi:hypothetical protein